MERKTLVLSSKEHNHLPNNKKIHAEKIINEVKSTAETSRTAPSVILQGVTTKCSYEVAFTCRQNIQCMHYFTSETTLPEPSCLDFEFESPNVLADIKDSENRYILFGSEVGLRLLSRSDLWLMDGTFKTCTVV